LPGAPALTRWLGGDPALLVNWRSVGQGLLLGWALFAVVILLENFAVHELGFSFRNFGVANRLQLRERLLYGFITSVGAPLFEGPTERIFLFSLFAWGLLRLWRVGGEQLRRFVDCKPAARFGYRIALHVGGRNQSADWTLVFAGLNQPADLVQRRAGNRLLAVRP
jgi:hypothetical protein